MNIEITEKYKASLIPFPKETLEPLKLPTEIFEFLTETGFESLKPFIAFVARNICELDNTAQKFDKLHSGESRFPFDLELVFIDVSHVILKYWGTEVNTQFDVVFEYSKDKFTLKKFGMIQDIPADWEQAPILEGNKSKQDKKKSFLQGIIHWM